MAQLDGAAIAGRQQRILAAASAVPHGANGMNHMPRGQTVTLGDLGAAGLATTERATFG